MKKKMKDVTFDEFSDWANRRACDGQWSMLTAMVSIEAISEVMKVKSIFHRKKKREEAWEKIKAENFMLDAEIDI